MKRKVIKHIKDKNSVPISIDEMNKNWDETLVDAQKPFNEKKFTIFVTILLYTIRGSLKK